MKISVFRIFLISLFIIIFLIFYKGLNNTNIYTPNFNSEKNIPYIESEIFNTNNKINSKEIFKGNKFYLMNIWASWCIPCRDEHPFLMKLSSLKNIEIIGLNYKDKNKNAKDVSFSASNSIDSDRYSTVVKMEKSFSREISGGEWKIFVAHESRWTLKNPKTKFAVVITVEDPKKDPEIDIFSSIRSECPNRYQNVLTVQNRIRT